MFLHNFINIYVNVLIGTFPLRQIVEYTSFDEMKKRDNLVGSVGPEDDNKGFFNMEVLKNNGGFFRKGKTVGEIAYQLT